MGKKPLPKKSESLQDKKKRYRKLKPEEVAYWESEGCCTESIRVFTSDSGVEFFGFFPEAIPICTIDNPLSITEGDTWHLYIPKHVPNYTWM